MTYEEAFLTAISNSELITSYDRLTNSQLGEVLKSVKRGGFNLEIDKCTGRLKVELEKFKDFFNEFIWTTFIIQTLKDNLNNE